MDRLSNLRQVLGKKLLEKVENSKILMVGSGGIGCELLKNLVMSGFKNIEIIDLDTIDLSNLNRQFLFQRQHIGKSKSKVARKSALEFNPNVNIVAHHANIKDPQFNIKWFKSFDIVMNALDNLDARRHVNTMCLAANVPLIESGTSGYLGQATVIEKNVTECFECQPKPTPKTFPICTIRSTPSAPIHCIVWAKNYLFAELFGKSEDNDEIDEEVTEENNKEIENLKKESQALKELYQYAGTPEYSEKVFDKVFNQDINRLLKMENLWKTRTKPTPINTEQYKKALEINMDVDEDKNDSKIKDDQKIYSIEENINMFKECLELLVQRQLKGKKIDPEFSMSFEKDDDIIMKFVAATANIRAHIFSIEQLNRFKIKEIAGNIIASIATTNAIISGIIIMDAYKILNNQLEECNTIYLTHDSSSNVFVKEFLAKPNPRCAVCRKSYFVLTINIEKFTLNDLLNKVLIKPKDNNGLGLNGDITICEDQRILYDFDFDDKLNDTFSKVKIEDGKYLNITCDDDDKMYNIMIYIINDSSLDKDFILEGDSTSISYILPPEPEPEPEPEKTNKRKHSDGDDANNKKHKVITVDIVDDDDKVETVLLD
ncbi:hypothetical protein BCR32DRAFT_229799 [Anaeromyces robustus]|uniref:Ubiquitin-activating enzyme E1-like n=1 Tax=Anaeromyces robustus TaxID=1754192 RepID=A0A1Y1XHX7_9FUNG|nr:hypothetical protein BCR32DRAFT_229799 [Anaeromyces robustus]|eukprot:ORX85343.1 hypothetical protein BCR32DRAFT_229799 [Anaeromyces robustus]